MNACDEIEKAGIRLVRPLLMDWCDTHEGFIDTNLFATPEVPQRLLGDFLILSKRTNVWVGVEVKTERTWTGNFYAETYSNAQPGEHERKGWLVTLRADWVVNVFLDVAVAVVMPLPQLRVWCIDQKNAFRYPVRNPHQEQRNLTQGHLVPYAELVQVGAVCPRFYFCGEDGRWVQGSFADVFGRKQAVRLVA